jgi:HD-GYP domain-containing protein (c-di-GMP phosphodiesterase class II)
LKIKKQSILRSIRKIILAVIIAIIFILLSFLYLQIKIQSKDNDDKQIINIFGKQRMYTQLITKNVNHLYFLMYSAQKSHTQEEVDEISKKIIEIKEDLLLTKEDVASTLESVHKGYLYVDTKRIDMEHSVKKASSEMDQLYTAWNSFSEAIDTFINANELNIDVRQAHQYINENNMKLLEICDTVLNSILQETISSAKRLSKLIYALIAMLSILVIFALFNLLRYIILPFNRIYDGISELGLTSYPSKSNLPTRKRVTPVVEEINEMFSKFDDLKSLIENINNKGTFTETLDFINRTFSNFIPYNYIGIALIEEDKKMIRASYGVSDGSITGLSENLVGKSWPIEETSLGRLLRSDKVRIINDLEKYMSNRPIKPYNQSIFQAGIRSSITLPLNVSGEPVGVIFFSSNQKNVYKEGHINILKTLANSIAISFHQNIFIDDIIYSSILALAKLAEARDEDTGEHLDRMKKYSRAIARFLYESHVYEDIITLEYVDKIERFSPLHDIGKVGIRDSVLLKPGKLTEEEFREMKRHTTFGAKVLKSAEDNIAKHGRALFDMGIDIAENHHEKWDGSGYPAGKKGEEIPLCARIVAVADVFDALTSKRPYKEAFSLDQAFAMIQEGRGKHFDPVIVDVFMEHRKEIEELYQQFKKAA